ncbi:MAG: ADP-glyceromanno-heptose 6-epimerase [Cytophagales bacterium]|nr:ADP-glyceromanno-heptose 6-epimerase [Armatimonadota bacterium]
MIIVTGGAGFIGSALVWKLNAEGISDILVVDELGTDEKWKNLVKRQFAEYQEKDPFLAAVEADSLPAKVEAIVHLGACSATTERNASYLITNNYQYTQTLARWAVGKGVRFIYASSAATYGDGALGFDDHDALIPKLQPLNMYGYSKQLFDLWAIRNGFDKQTAGVKFFNVYGPNEYHKDFMTSLVHKAYGQIQETGTLKLFRSEKPEYADGEQKRDFVYVKDCVDVLHWLLQNPSANGIFNLGSGKARSWNDLASAIFAAMDRERNIAYVDLPETLRGKYQYFTEATTHKLRALGCPMDFPNLEDRVADYVRGYLRREEDPYL